MNSNLENSKDENFKIMDFIIMKKAVKDMLTMLISLLIAHSILQISKSAPNWRAWIINVFLIIFLLSIIVAVISMFNAAITIFQRYRVTKIKVRTFDNVGKPNIFLYRDYKGLTKYLEKDRKYSISYFKIGYFKRYICRVEE